MVRGSIRISQYDETPLGLHIGRWVENEYIGSATRNSIQFWPLGIAYKREQLRDLVVKVSPYSCSTGSWIDGIEELEERGIESFSIVLADVAVELCDWLFACSVIVGVTFLFCVRTSYKAKTAIKTPKIRATGQRIITLKMTGFDILIESFAGIIGVRRHVVLKRLVATVPSIQME